MPAREDRDLLDRLRRGESRAFNEVISEHQDRIYNFVYRMLGDEQEAQDVAQDVFVAFFTHIKGFRGESSITTWLYRIALNQTKNRMKYLRIRRLHRQDMAGRDEDRPTELPQGVRPGFHASVPRPDQMAEGLEMERLIQRALAQLDEEERSLVVFRDIQGMSYDEISQVLGLPLGTVKSKLHRARMALKEKLTRLTGRVP